MLTYLLRRILLMIPTLLGISIIVFTVMAMSPGGISAQTLVGGMDMKPDERQALLDYYNKRYGLDQPAYMQYLHWLNNISPIGFTRDEQGNTGQFSFSKGMDLGVSFQYGRPVADILAERIPITLLLNLVTIPATYLIAILVGMKSATKRGSGFDVGIGISMMALWSIPTMLAGVLLLGFFANVQHFQWFPTAGIGSREWVFTGQGLASGLTRALPVLWRFCSTGETNQNVHSGKLACRLCPHRPRQRPVGIRCIMAACVS
jgi:ABC-type dipeptide/oligopeptide/nickel transport system permease component